MSFQYIFLKIVLHLRCEFQKLTDDTEYHTVIHFYIFSLFMRKNKVIKTLKRLRLADCMVVWYDIGRLNYNFVFFQSESHCKMYLGTKITKIHSPLRYLSKLAKLAGSVPMGVVTDIRFKGSYHADFHTLRG